MPFLQSLVENLVCLYVAVPTHSKEGNLGCLCIVLVHVLHSFPFTSLLKPARLVAPCWRCKMQQSPRRASLLQGPSQLCMKYSEMESLEGHPEGFWTGEESEIVALIRIYIYMCFVHSSFSGKSKNLKCPGASGHLFSSQPFPCYVCLTSGSQPSLLLLEKSWRIPALLRSQKCCSVCLLSAGKCIWRCSAPQQTQLRDGCKVKEEPVRHVPHGMQIPGNLSDIQLVQTAAPAPALQPAYNCFPLWLMCLSVQHRLHLGFPVCLVAGWVFQWLLLL